SSQLRSTSFIWLARRSRQDGEQTYPAKGLTHSGRRSGGKDRRRERAGANVAIRQLGGGAFALPLYADIGKKSLTRYGGLVKFWHRRESGPGAGDELRRPVQAR